MNAPAKIAPARDRYIPIVTHHMPGCQGDELQLRCSILLMRDQATSNLTRCSEEAYGILNTIQRLANAYAYARIPVDELKELRYRLLQLTGAASAIEMFAYRLSQSGEAHEGG